MTIKKTILYKFLFVVVIFSELYLPSFKFNTFLQIAVLLLYMVFDKIILSKSLFNLLKYLIFILIIGFLGSLFNQYALINICKDILHFIKPILGLLIGYFFLKKINNFETFIKIIVFLGFASAVIHFGIILFFSKVSNVSDIREFGKDNFLELFATLFLLYYQKFLGKSLFESRLKYRILLYTLLLSCFFYFSRTMIIVSIILILSIYGYTIINKKMLVLIGIFILTLTMFYTYLFSIKIERDKSGLDSFLYKIKIAPEELFKTKIDLENHKDLWDHWRGYEAKRAIHLMCNNPSSFIFGAGYGSLVNLKFKAPLTEEKEGIKFISELHNGYIYNFYKTGIFGVIVLILFFINLYKFIYKFPKKSFVNVFISAIGLVYIFTTLTITGIYNTKDSIIFILGALMYFESNLNLNPEKND